MGLCECADPPIRGVHITMWTIMITQGAETDTCETDAWKDLRYTRMHTYSVMFLLVYNY